MKLIAAVLCLATIAFARPQRGQYSGDLRNVPILKYNFDGPNPDGSYQYDFETGNGIQHNEQGYLKAEDTQVKQGSFSYTGPDGVVYTINYIADEDGFRAEGAHIPTPPPIPEAIQRSLAYNAAHPEPQAPGGRFFRK